MNLPDLYARVCAVRPELAVNADDGPWTLAHDGTDWDWVYHSTDDGVIWRCEEMTEKHAAALILARWVEGLPFHVSLQLTFGSDGKEWLVSGWIGEDEFDRYGATPIEALAAFYLGDA